MKRMARCGAIYCIIWLAIGSGCSKHENKQAQRRLPVTAIANTKNEDRRADVIFVHGLGGDSVGTWTSGTGFFWPEKLGKQVKDVGVWTVDYSAIPSDWLGKAMPVEDRSKNLLEELSVAGIGEKPIVFIAHSLGGIMVKQMLMDSCTKAGDGDKWGTIGPQTRGVVFLGTPNTGSNVATLVACLKKLAPQLRLNVAVDQLKANAPLLRDLNIWYRNNVEERKIKTKVFYESKLLNAVLIVDEGSSDPGISGVTPIRLDGDHFTVCKPIDEFDLAYSSVTKFINEDVAPNPTHWRISFVDFVSQFKSLKNDGSKLAEFRKVRIGQRVTWSGTIVRATPHEGRPTYAIAASKDADAVEYCMASFSPKHFRPDLLVGTEIEISGIISEETSSLGVILDDCRFVGSRH